MAIVTITVDTEANTLKASIDGKEVNEVTYASAYMYNDYYTKNKPRVSWNVTANNATDEDEFSSYVNYCSATASVAKNGDIQIKLTDTKVIEAARASVAKDIYGSVSESTKADIAKFMLAKNGRKGRA